MQRLRVIGAALAGIMLLGTAAACGSDEKAGSEEKVVVDITVEDGAITPKGDRVKVSAGQPIDLVVTADTAGSLHVHSDPEQEFPYESGTQTFPITIDRPGVIEVESHDPAQIVVQLEVR
ncbi:cupredoxin domain-containing protein [Nocardioides daeguensis]|uniref:EfeO-type cupredoxin-like domain-containing protein n=1 Tax=Nocardioides daeguensis TaxID=908359 RepID=A0ABP6VWG4_9ACTN|nr:cupredoxin domain-containing protein [Nocardioides daeguensis]MBV6728473.1 cupredoxin domain-containing protein [Nocardioides daeguensis]MCR1773897.1 cupredoxin domain-containing protein [Nocardioides daeguensis]